MLGVPLPCFVCNTTRTRTRSRECSHCRRRCCLPQCGLQVRTKCICLCCAVPHFAEATAAVVQAEIEAGIAASVNDVAMGWAAGVVAVAKSTAGVTIRNPAAQHLARGPVPKSLKHAQMFGNGSASPIASQHGSSSISCLFVICRAVEVGEPSLFRAPSFLQDRTAT